MKANCIVCQSGGPTCVLNASLYGVIKEAEKHEEIDKIYGAFYGIEGIINEEFIDLRTLDKENIELLKQTPGAFLKSVRHRLSEDINDEEYQMIYRFFQKYNIRYFYYIGGNDSMDTVAKLTKFFRQKNYSCSILGIPKTIDNDLLCTDHTPGYGSALKFVATAISEIKVDTSSYKKGRVTIVEIMGRDAGWLTAGSKLASLNQQGPDLIFLPESPFDTPTFLQQVNEIYQRKQNVLVCVSEGIKDANGEYVQNHLRRFAVKKDKFSHIQLGGIALYLTEIVKQELHLPTRAIELNLLQRCAVSLQAKTDVLEAIRCGKTAVKASLKMKTGKMVCLKRKNTIKYSVYCVLEEVDKIANQVKSFPQHWIVNGNNIAAAFIDYAHPLIQDDYPIQWEKGMPKFAKLK